MNKKVIIPYEAIMESENNHGLYSLFRISQSAMRAIRFITDF